MSKLKRFPVKDGKTTFGMHLMVDIYGVPFKKLDDMKLVYKFLHEVPEMIGMSRLSTPLVVNADETASKHDPGGISGVILINESHISIHTFAKKGFATLDVYSCSDFDEDVEVFMKYLKKMFPFKKKEVQITKRGKKYPSENTQ